MTERHIETDNVEADIDTQEIEALQDSTNVKSEDDTVTQPEPPPDNNPYSTLDSLHTLSRKKPRRTLDDMRKLSEEIKKTRGEKKDS